MAARIPFEPYDYANELCASETSAYADKQLVEWNGRHWEIVEDDEALRRASAWLKSKGIRHHVTPNNAKSAVKTAQLLLPRLAAASDEPLVPALNGYVLAAPAGLTLLAHDKSKCLRHVVKCNFDPHAPVPKKFQKFIEQVLPDEDVRAYVQEYMGYTLIHDARHQRAQIWLGNGANGKGVLANILQKLHAKVAAVSLDNLDGFKLAPLIDVSLIYCDEAPEGKLKANRLKSLIAGETVTIDQKFKDIISKGILAKWLILSNHVPKVSDHSEGFWRRFDIVPFPVHIPEGERDPMLAQDIIRDELSGVLNWVLEGLVRLLARGQFNPKLPGPMRRAKIAARTVTSTVAAWADEVSAARTTVADASRVKVYRNYKDWCRENGVAAESSIEFWRRLDALIGPLQSNARAKTREGFIRVTNVRLEALHA
ncbi:hypothetical protein WI85_16510 [Burkholderia ubonensis]|uniref:DNA primase family protein n=1 Tax=Burkholderia ubonensis TaxID=101571 RepID=UPI000752A3BD|nr:phage/plasmid primase, P4 family [Burkholderia ubonensis]KVD48832.1 hypothetical protein WI85_16510 [Burkholderia ubonensis]